jgi:hypothetical protein
MKQEMTTTEAILGAVFLFMCFAIPVAIWIYRTGGL